MNKESLKVAIIDATAAGKGRREFTRDAIGCGVRSIGGILEQNNIDFKISLSEKIIDQGFDSNYNTLFISGMSMDKTAIRKIITLWRKNNNGKVVVGGPITAELRSILIDINADIIVIGEGEVTVKELIDKNVLLSDKEFEVLKNINGIGYLNEKNEPIINQFRRYSTTGEFRSFKAAVKCIRDYPNYFSAKVYIECVRGCSNFKGTRLKLFDGRECTECGYCESDCLEDRAKCPENIPPGCGFCSVPSLFGPARSKTIKHVDNELGELLEIGVRRIVLSAPDFLDFGRDDLITPKPLINPTSPEANIDKIEELLQVITSHKKVLEGKVWIEIENIKATLFTEEIAKLISKYLPNTTFSIGCETGSEEHAKLLGRPSGPQDVFRAVKLAHKYNLKTHIYFIHGLPGQNKKVAMKTAQYIHEIEPFIDKVTIYRFKPLPLSAFGDFPEPKPAIKDPISRIITQAANEVNFAKKRNLLNKIVKVIISEPNFQDEKGAIAYILEGGPKVVIENAREKIGEIVNVKITRILSEKLVFGIISNP